MLLTPKRWKFRKQHVKPLSGKSVRGSYISFGDMGLKAVTSGYLSNKQLEAARKVVVRHTRKVGQIRFRVFPNTPITKKGLEMPMGTGKGDVDHYAAAVRKGKIIFEVSGLAEEDARKVLISAGKKLSVRTRVVLKGEVR
ncbi:50S ribosomal protein L16 [Candidatus Gracilibacteria bacterium]|nr:50S ribosomal protein L16 [Candidatus Gracilibacteria bacterium]